MSNELTPIEGGKTTHTENKPTSIAKSKGKADRCDLYLNIYAAVCKLPNIYPDFPLDFRFIQSDDGVKLPIVVNKQQVCQYVADSYVIDSIVEYAHKELAHMNTKLTHSQAVECFKMVRSMAPKMKADDISPVNLKTDSGLCWHRLPFDLEDGPTPVFDEMFSRIDAPKSVMAWIGSLLDPQADLQQYLWIYGDGQNGKSSLSNFLRKVLGPAHRAEQVPDMATRRFWTAGILGKRLVCFADCDNTNFPASSFFKGLTGEDSQRIEKKGKDPFDAEIKAKYLFLSNRRPEVTGGKSDTRRALYVEMRPFVGRVLGQVAYGAQLWAEGSQMLYKCVRAYEEIAGAGESIPVDEDSRLKLEELTSLEDDRFQLVMDRREIVSTREYAEESRAVAMPERRYITPAEMQEALVEEGFMRTSKQAEFFEWLRRVYGVEKKRVRVDGKLEWRYIGAWKKNARF